MGEGVGFQFGDDQRDDGVVTLALTGTDRGPGGAGAEPVVAVGREQFGTVAGKWLVSLDPTHDQAAGDVVDVGRPVKAVNATSALVADRVPTNA